MNTFTYFQNTFTQQRSKDDASIQSVGDVIWKSDFERQQQDYIKARTLPSAYEDCVSICVRDFGLQRTEKQCEEFCKRRQRQDYHN